MNATRGDERSLLLKRLFGRAVRVDLAAWIRGRDGQPFFQTEAQQAMLLLGHAASSTSGELQNFVFSGMLLEQPTSNRVYYVELASSLWSAFDAIEASLRDVSGGVPNSSSPGK